MRFLFKGFVARENNPISIWDFKCEGFAEIWIVAGRLFALAWFTAQMKESLGAESLG